MVKKIEFFWFLFKNQSLGKWLKATKNPFKKFGYAEPQDWVYLANFSGESSKEIARWAKIHQKWWLKMRNNTTIASEIRRVMNLDGTRVKLKNFLIKIVKLSLSRHDQEDWLLSRLNKELFYKRNVEFVVCRQDNDQVKDYTIFIDNKYRSDELLSCLANNIEYNFFDRYDDSMKFVHTRFFDPKREKGCVHGLLDLVKSDYPNSEPIGATPRMRVTALFIADKTWREKNGLLK